MLTQDQKQKITEHLEAYIQRFESQTQAANSLSDVSPATISQILNDKTSQINDKMWRNIAAQIGFSSNPWVTVETRDFKYLKKVLKDAQENSIVFGVIGDEGSGKTFTNKHYYANYKNTYLLKCADYWNKKYFLAELLSAMGRDNGGLSVAEMMYEIVRILKKTDRPIIILDEADKLTDQVLYFFITLYNELEDQCGIVITGTDHLKKRIIRGVRLNKKGYKEIYSRIGRKFIELKGVGTTDITQLCMANGIDDRKVIREIIDDSEMDLRRVRRRIHAINKQQTKQ
jgi:DNA transposition AAA+ family ATPase